MRGATQKFGEFKQGSEPVVVSPSAVDTASSKLCECVPTVVKLRESVIYFSEFCEVMS